MMVGAGQGIADLVVREFLAPFDLAGFLVQRIDTGVQGAEIDLVAIDCGAPVDDVAAGADVVGQAGLELPLPLAGLGVKRPHAGIGSGDIDRAVMDDRLGFLAALLFIAEREGPSGAQVPDGFGVDLVQAGKPLGVVAHAIHQHVAGCFMVVQDVFPGDIRGHGGRKAPATSSARALTDGMVTDLRILSSLMAILVLGRLSGAAADDGQGADFVMAPLLDGGAAVFGGVGGKRREGGHWA